MGLTHRLVDLSQQLTDISVVEQEQRRRTNSQNLLYMSPYGLASRLDFEVS